MAFGSGLGRRRLLGRRRVGAGAADKDQVAFMIKRLLPTAGPTAVSVAEFGLLGLFAHPTCKPPPRPSHFSVSFRHRMDHDEPDHLLVPRPDDIVPTPASAGDAGSGNVATGLPAAADGSTTTTSTVSSSSATAW